MEIEQMKEQIREAFRKGKQKLPEGYPLFYGGSPSKGGYVDIPVGYMPGVDPKEMYHPEYFWAENYGITWDELLKITYDIMEEVKGEK
jgi:hypothetical protein